MNAHSITFDKLVYLDRLKSAGIPEDVARAHADGLDQALKESVATKSDLEKTELALRNEIAAGRVDLDKVETSLRNDLEKVETSLRNDIEKVETSLRNDIEKVETSLRNDIAKLETSLRNEIQKVDLTLRREIEASKNSILLWLIPFLLSAILPSLYTALKAAGVLH